MSSSMYLYGIKPQTEEWHKMRQAYEACASAGVTPPKKVLDFFGFDEYDEEDISNEGVIVTLANYTGPQDVAVSSHNNEMQEGYVVDLTLLDPQIKQLLFYVSY